MAAAVLALLALGCRAVGGAEPEEGKALKDQLPWYHTGEEVHAALQELSTTCVGASLELSRRTAIARKHGGGEVDLEVVRIRHSERPGKTRAFLMFGEHARELITVESALHFASLLCGSGPDSEEARKVLETVTFTLVPNANPLGRARVEAGELCKRTNENNVDINRNWGQEHRDESMSGSGQEQDPGPTGFSEPETRILRDLVLEEKPDVFLTVHSGAFMLATPFGYTQDRKPKNSEAMLDVLRAVGKETCPGECPVGQAAKVINYEAHACDIDWASESAGVPYAYVWEIWVDPRRKETYASLARRQQEPLSGAGLLVETGKLALERESDECEFSMFNPTSRDDTKASLERWTPAYLRLAREVAARSQQKPGGLVRGEGTSVASMGRLEAHPRRTLAITDAGDVRALGLRPRPPSSG